MDSNELEENKEQALREMGKYSDPPCHLCGRPGTHYFADNAGAWVCEDAPYCDEK